MFVNSRIYRFFILTFASGGGAGYFPVASGTFSTLIPGIPLYLLVAGLPPVWYLGFLILFIVFSIAISTEADLLLREKDSHKIVIDEFCGFLVTMMFIPLNIYTIAAGFILFRFFDIGKFQPAKWVEDKLPGGASVTLDDVIAGIYSNILLRIGILVWENYSK